MTAFQQFDENRNSIWGQVSDRSDAELVNLKSSNLQAYYDLLEADRFYDFGRREALRAIPEVADYLSTIDQMRTEARKLEDLHRTRYEMTSENARRVYEFETAAARRAYERARRP